MTNEITSSENKTTRSLSIWVFSLVAIIFGVLTLKSASAVLFFSEAAREAAGNYVPFVLWFNFVAGIFYIIAGIRLWLMKSCVVWLTVAIAVSTLVVFVALGVHISTDGAYEMRTVYAMVVRSVVWLTIATFAWRYFKSN